jgi:hypothetical protein
VRVDATREGPPCVRHARARRRSWCDASRVASRRGRRTSRGNARRRRRRAHDGPPCHPGWQPPGPRRRSPIRQRAGWGRVKARATSSQAREAAWAHAAEEGLIDAAAEWKAQKRLMKRESQAKARAGLGRAPGSEREAPNVVVNQVQRGCTVVQMRQCGRTPGERQAREEARLGQARAAGARLPSATTAATRYTYAVLTPATAARAEGAARRPRPPGGRGFAQAAPVPSRAAWVC